MTWLRGIVAGIILCSVVVACGSNQAKGFRVTGTLTVNGPGVNYGVLPGGTRVFALPGIVAGNHYRLRTQIAPGGTLAGIVYETQQAYLDSAPTITALASHPTYTYLYEADFTAPSTGSYLIALSGTPVSNVESLFFYDLRLLSSSETTTFAAAPTAPAVAANTASIAAGYVHIYSGSTISSAGSYTVSLTTAATTSISNPQLFVYADASLATDSLLYSSYATTEAYKIYSAASDTTYDSQTNEIPDIAFSATGPFILIKGNASVEYTLTVSP